MPIILSPQNPSLAKSDHPISKEETTFVVQCHDRTFKTITVLDSSSLEIFTCESPGVKSWTWHRSIKDKTGPLEFELRHFKNISGDYWTVETPSGKDIATIKHTSLFAQQRSALDMTLQDQTKIEVRPTDDSAIRTLVNVRDECIAEIQLTGSNDIVDLSNADRSTWQVQVAGGVDIALVSLAEATGAFGSKC